MLQATPTFTSALLAETPAQFKAIMAEKIPGIMLALRVEHTFATGYMPGNQFSQKNVRRFFLVQLRQSLEDHRPCKAEGLATGQWQLPCGLTAEEAYAFARNTYDKLGTKWDANPSNPLPIWDGTWVKMRPPKAGTYRRPPSRPAQSSRPSYRQHTPAQPEVYQSKFAKTESEKRSIWQKLGDWVEKQKLNLLHRYTQFLKKRAKKRHRKQLKEEAARADANRKNATPAQIDLLNRGKFPTISFRSVPDKDENGKPFIRRVVAKNHMPEEEHLMPTFGLEVTTEVLPEGQETRFYRDPLDRPDPWKNSPACTPRPKGPDQTPPQEGSGRAHRRAQQLGDQELAQERADNTPPNPIQDPEFARQQRGKEFWEEWQKSCAEDPTLSAAMQAAE